MKKITFFLMLISFYGYSQLTAPYSENFDAAATLPQYWNTIITTPYSEISIRDNISNTAPNSVQLTSGSDASGDVIFVSPRFTDLDQYKQVKFNIRTGSNGVTGFSIGTLSDPNDGTTFNLIANYDINFISDTWQEVIVTFENHNGTDQFIGIRHSEDSLLFNILIDDFVYENIDCVFIAPYAENFDAATTLPQCWNTITTTPYSEISIRDNISNTAPNSVQLTSGSDASGDVIFVSPRFTDLDQYKQVKFNIRIGSNGVTGFSIGTLSDPNDGTTFNLIANYDINFISDTWQEVIVTFENYNGTDQFIGIRHSEDSLLFNILIDDFVYESNTADVNDYSFSNLKVYPIPTNDILTVSNSEIINNISVYSVLGKKLYTFKPNNKNYTIRLNNLSAGKYFIKIVSNQNSKSVLFIKN